MSVLGVPGSRSKLLGSRSSLVLFENWAWKSPCSLQCRAWKQKQQKPNQNGHSPKRNHQKGRHAIQKVRSKVRSKTKFWEVKKMRDQILEDSIVAFTLANLKNLYLRVVLNFDFWAMVQLAFHGVLQIGFPFYKFEYEIIGVPWAFKVSAEFHGGSTSSAIWWFFVGSHTKKRVNYSIVGGKNKWKVGMYSSWVGII